MNNAFSAALAGVSVYRNLLELPPVAALRSLFRTLERGEGEAALEAYSAAFYALAQAGYDSFCTYLTDQLRYRGQQRCCLYGMSGTGIRHSRWDCWGFWF